MFVRAPMFLIMGAISMVTLAPGFGVVVLCSLPVLALALLLILSKATPLYSKVQSKLDKVNSVVQENVSGARVVKAHVREEYENSRFQVANNDLRIVNYKALRLMAFLSMLPGIANYFRITVDELLGNDTAGQKEDIRQFFEQYFSLTKNGEKEQAFQLALKYARKYPQKYGIATLAADAIATLPEELRVEHLPTLR